MDIKFSLRAKQLAELNKWNSLNEFCKNKLEENPEEKYALYYLALSYQALGDL